MSNAINAITSYKSFLMYKYGGNWTKLVDVKEIPDLGSAPEMLDATTQSDGQRVFKPGIQENEALTFTANYTLAEFNMLKALEGTNTQFAVWYGGTEDAMTGDVTPTGENGKFEFWGDLRVTKSGSGVNAIHDMSITIAPSSAIIQTVDVEVLPSVTLDKHALKMTVGDTYTFRATTTPAGKSITWASSATAKASVAAGTVTAAQAGSTIITATITDGGVDYNDTCTVIVEAAQ